MNGDNPKPHPSRIHLWFFLVGSLLMAGPGIFMAYVGCFLVVPPVLAGFGIYLVYRYYRSLKAASDQDYRIRTHNLSLVMNLVTAACMGFLIIKGSLPWQLIVAAIYPLICCAIALHAKWREEAG
jgi:uncharacterized membrane-anchored protein